MKRIIPLMVLVALGNVAHAADAQWFPLEGLALCAPATPTDAEFLAIRHFAREVERFSGAPLPLYLGAPPAGSRVLMTGTRATLPDVFDAQGWHEVGDASDADVSNQSYVLAVVPEVEGVAGPVLVAAGFGRDRAARASLGMGYALGDLLRRLDVEEGQWGFRLSDAPAIHSPASANRTLYHMVSRYASDGVSLLYYTPEQTEAYVDRLVDARYSRVTFWQYSDFVLYPGNREGGEGGVADWRGHAQQVAQQMRRYMEYARRRGLEVYQMLTPAQISSELIPAGPHNVREGFEGYGKDAVCWSQAESREVARKVCRAQMEYYGPMDGYMVWFYDPAGCFCAECRDRQDELLFSQLTMVQELARTISPNARLGACLWPTWIFPEYQDQGIPFTGEQRDAFVSAFLDRCSAHFGPRRLTVMDSCEYDHTNLYNGLVAPDRFRREAFLYGATGFHGEAANAFAPFKLRYIPAQMALALQRGVEDGMIYVYFEETNFPSVFVFADSLYSGTSDWRESVRRYAQTVAKGEALASFVELLTALDEFDYAPNRFSPEDPASPTSQTDAMLAAVAETTRPERVEALARAERAWDAVTRSAHWYGNSDWMRGYLLAQQWLVRLGDAEDEEAYAALWEGFVDETAAIPMYADYMRNLINAPFARAHWPKR